METTMNKSVKVNAEGYQKQAQVFRNGQTQGNYQAAGI